MRDGAKSLAEYTVPWVCVLTVDLSCLPLKAFGLFFSIASIRTSQKSTAEYYVRPLSSSSGRKWSIHSQT